MSEERRKHIRTEMNCEIKIMHESFGEKICTVRDLSDGGIFAVTESSDFPSVGSVLTGQVQGLSEGAPLLKMEIVRKGQSGVSFKFVD